jgi:hypothetical protein
VSSDRLGQKGIKRDIDQRRGTPADGPTGLDDPDATAPVFVADHRAHQHRAGRPFAAKAEPVRRARSTKSCSKFWAKAQRKVNIEYHKIVICSHTHPAESVGQGTGKPPA